ncbi:unnamed protein product, partial [Durusdinium trenchii]
MVDLSRLGKKSFVSQSALSQVLADLRNAEELPSACSRQSIKRARVAAIGDLTPFGSVVKEWSVETKTGGQKNVTYVCPAAMLHFTAQKCPGWSAALKQLLSQKTSTPASPYRLILYADEISPGNVLKADNRRKVFAIYWAIELGGSLLSAEPSWFILTCLRSSIVRKEVADGFAQLAKLAFLSFVEPGMDFRSGLQLDFHCGGTGFLSAVPTILVSDEGAIRDCFASKGASGSLMCILCRTTVSKASTLARSSDSVIEHTELDVRKFVLHSDATLRDNHRHLAAQSAVLNKSQFSSLQQRLGINYCPRGLLALDTVQACGFSVTEGLCYDWMHCYMVSGLFHLEVTLLLGALAGAGIRQEEVHQYVSTFVWPSWIGGRAVDATKVLEKKVDLSKDKFKSSASEGLSLYPVLLEFLRCLDPRRVTEKVAAARKVFQHLCGVMDLLLLAANAGRVAPCSLQNAITLHFMEFTQVYGKDFLPPKAHFAMHLPWSLEKHGFLPSCFVQERRHKELKRYANQTATGVPGVERSVLEEVTLSHTMDLEQYNGHGELDLVKGKEASGELHAAFCKAHQLLVAPGLTVGRSVTFGLGKRSVAVGDVVEIMDGTSLGRICQVKCFVKFEATMFSLVSVWDDVDVKSSSCRPMENQVW